MLLEARHKCSGTCRLFGHAVCRDLFCLPGNLRRLWLSCLSSLSSQTATRPGRSWRIHRPARRWGGRLRKRVATYWAACHRWPKAKITLRQEARIIHKSWEANRLTSAGFGNRVLVGDPLHNSARNGSTIDRFCETAVIVARGSARLPTLQPGATINAGCQLTSVPSAKSAITAKVGSARVDLRGPLSYHTGSFCSSLDADVLRPPNANARQL